MLNKEDGSAAVKVATTFIDTPHIIGAICLDGEKYFYGIEVKEVTPNQLIVFALNLLYLATDYQVTDDEVLSSIQQLRKYIGRYGGKIEPPKTDEAA